MEEDDKGCPMIRLGVSGWVFLLVPAYPGCPGQTAVKWLLFVATVGCGSVVKVVVCSLRCSQVQQWGGQCGMGYGEGFPEKNEDFLLKCCFFHTFWVSITANQQTTTLEWIDSLSSKLHALPIIYLPPHNYHLNSADLHQSQEHPLAKVWWTCLPQSTPRWCAWCQGLIRAELWRSICPASNLTCRQAKLSNGGTESTFLFVYLLFVFIFIRVTYELAVCSLYERCTV